MNLCFPIYTLVILWSTRENGKHAREMPTGVKELLPCIALGARCPRPPRGSKVTAVSQNVVRPSENGKNTCKNGKNAREMPTGANSCSPASHWAESDVRHAVG